MLETFLFGLEFGMGFFLSPFVLILCLIAAIIILVIAAIILLLTIRLIVEIVRFVYKGIRGIFRKFSRNKQLDKID